MSKKRAPTNFAHPEMMPTPEQAVLALDFGNRPVSAEYVADPEDFEPMRKPTHIDDWLAQYYPCVQTVKMWQRHYNKFKDAGRRVVYLVGLGELSEAKHHISLQTLAEFTQAFFFPLKVKIAPHFFLSPIDTPGKKTTKRGYSLRRPAAGADQEDEEFHLKWRRCHKYYEHRTPADHRQIEVDSILDVLEDTLPDDAMVYIGVTMEDLYEGKDDNFTVGMATSAKDRIGVFSFFRYSPWNPFDDIAEVNEHLKTDAKKKQAMLERCFRVLAHELLHLLSIDHCSYYNCLMNGSGHLSEDFAQPMHLCPVDLQKFVMATGSTVGDHYTKLLAYYSSVGLKDAATWIQARMDRIKGKGAKTTPAKASATKSSTEVASSSAQKPAAAATTKFSTEVKSSSAQKPAAVATTTSRATRSKSASTNPEQTKKPPISSNRRGAGPVSSSKKLAANGRAMERLEDSTDPIVVISDESEDHEGEDEMELDEEGAEEEVPKSAVATRTRQQNLKKRKAQEDADTKEEVEQEQEAPVEKPSRPTRKVAPKRAKHTD